MITIKNICTTFSTLENGCRFFFFLADRNRYENKLRNREVGAARRWSRKRAVRWRDQTAGDVSEETSVFTYPFFRACARQTWHFSYLSLFKQSRARSLKWELHNEKLRCIKPLLSLAFVTAVVATELGGNIFSDTPEWCSVFCISAEHRDGGEVDCGKYKTREPPLILFFNHTHKEKKGGWQKGIGNTDK